MAEVQKRSWGTYEKLVDGRVWGYGYWVKLIRLEPGKEISLQTHNHRSEHWFVVHGLIATKKEERSRVLSKGMHTTIMQGEIHKMENIGKGVAIVVEVALGDELSEDDVVRHD